MTLNTINECIIITHAHGFVPVKKYWGDGCLAAPYRHTGHRLNSWWGFAGLILFQIPKAHKTHNLKFVCDYSPVTPWMSVEEHKTGINQIIQILSSPHRNRVSAVCPPRTGSCLDQLITISTFCRSLSIPTLWQIVALCQLCQFIKNMIRWCSLCCSIAGAVVSRSAVKLKTKLHEVWNCTITEKAPIRAFSWLKAPAIALSHLRHLDTLLYRH